MTRKINQFKSRGMSIKMKRTSWKGSMKTTLKDSDIVAVVVRKKMFNHKDKIVKENKK